MVIGNFWGFSYACLNSRNAIFGGQQCLTPAKEEKTIDLLGGFITNTGISLDMFDEFYTTRVDWCKILHCDRETIRRWENQVVRLVIPILIDYRKGRFLDNYQRYILALIYAHSNGLVDGKKRVYTEIKDWLKSNASILTREQFNNWVEAYVYTARDK